MWTYATFHTLRHAGATGKLSCPADPPSADVTESRRQLLEESGRNTGFRGGKAERAWELRQALEGQIGRLNTLYDFRTLISREGWLPPVIDEAVDVAHITPRQIRTASHVYEIIVPERFVSNPPSWRTWLMAGLSSSGPDETVAVTPENRLQKALWQAAVRQGWGEGRQSADQTLEANFNRLTRDYRGMLMYSPLLRQGFITAPVVTDQQQTVTGIGKADHRRSRTKPQGERRLCSRQNSVASGDTQGAAMTQSTQTMDFAPTLLKTG